MNCSHACLLACLAMPCWAYDPLEDPFDVQSETSISPVKGVVATDCQSTADVPTPLTLVDAVERALCHNPKTQQAWAQVKTQAAAVGVGLSAYLPTINGRGSWAKGDRNSRFANDSRFDTSVVSEELSGNVNLNWVLYDFGLRAANLESARQLLNAANASQDDTLQTVFLNTVKAFYETQAAQSLLDALREAERSAEKSFKAAEAKYVAGAGSLADKLQAETAHAQSIAKRVQAQGELRDAQGSLAILMGLRPDRNLVILAIADEPDLENNAFAQAVDQLINQALQQHPKIRVAQSQLKAAEAKIDATRAEGRPRLSLTASQDYFNTDATPINNQGKSQQTVDSQRIGLQVDVPLFEGFGRTYKVREAETQLEAKQAELADAEQQVALEVWKSYQALQTGAENLKASHTVLASARQSFDVAQGRYKAGVGSILELLKAQSDLASAQQQKLLAITRWQTDRIRLATSLGRFDF